MFSTMLLGSGGVSALGLNPSEDDYALKLLGKFVFFDEISRPKGVMSCATCHEPEAGWTGPESDVNLHQVAMEGAKEGRFGTLKPPASAYTSDIQPFTALDGPFPGFFKGGHFWDGRAEGKAPADFPESATRHIGEEVFYKANGKPLDDEVFAYAKYFSPISDQALNPMPNPDEQNIDRKRVCKHVKKSPYADLYELVWGVKIKCNNKEVSHQAVDQPLIDGGRLEANYDIAFKRLMLAVGAYQHSLDVNSKTSKRDYALKAEQDCLEGHGVDAVCEDPDFINSPGTFPLVWFSPKENLGHDIFYNIESELNPDPDGDGPLTSGLANCGNNCHRSTEDPLDDGHHPDERYADDRFHNIGTPYNPEIAEYTGQDVGPDEGLFLRTGIGFNRGQHKTPTLRNVDKRPDEGFVKAYTHNGWFKSLESLMHFYNTSLIGNCVITEDEDCTDRGETAISRTTAAKFGITRCPDDIQTEVDALANNCWPAPAVDGAIPRRGPDGLGNLGLTKKQEEAVVAYMKTLSDNFTPKPPTLEDLKKLGIKVK
jgi:cytochrome c peroxidase